MLGPEAEFVGSVISGRIGLVLLRGSCVCVCVCVHVRVCIRTYEKTDIDD